jgi:DDE superfamily endonuclease
VPLIDDNGLRLTFMQDSAPAHAAIGTVADLRERGIVCVKWPAYSPDLNPIEKLWNWMKDWIQDRYNNNLTGYNALREAVQAAWEAVPEAYLEYELLEMPNRCQAVINANGEQTRY